MPDLLGDAKNHKRSRPLGGRAGAKGAIMQEKNFFRAVIDSTAPLSVKDHDAGKKKIDQNLKWRLTILMAQ